MVTEDFEPMTARALAICEQTAAVRELVEARELLRWMVNGGLVFLGYRSYRVLASPASSDGRQVLEIEPGSGLGILRDESRSRFARPKPLAEIDPRERKLLFDGPALIIGKTHALSRVHRAVAMDDITIRRATIRRAGEAENTVAFDRFVGLFTSKARADEAAHVPVLRAKLLEVLAAERALPGSHDFKQIITAFNSFPKEELFRASVAELRSQLGHILDLKTQVRVNLYPDPDRRSVVALVMMPRDRFSAGVRIEIQEALQRALGGPLVYYHLAIGEGYAAQLHFCFSAPPPAPGVAAKLGEEVARLARTWEDRLREQLAARFGEPRGREIASRWEDAFGPDYIATADAVRAARDIEAVEAMLAGGAPEVELGRRAGVEGSGELRIYELGKAPALSELMPILQNFGIRVLSEDAHELRPSIGGEKKPASVQSFRVQSVKGTTLDKLPGAPLLAAALRAVRMGLAEDDPLNALTLEAGLAWREVALVRAWMAVAFQMRLAPARPALSRVLILHPGLARMLVDLFIARLDPDRDSPALELAELRAGYLNGLAAVENIEDDRVARRLTLAGRSYGAHQLFRPGAHARSVYRAQIRQRQGSRVCPTTRRSTRSTSTARGWRAAICARGGSRAEESVSAIAPTTTGPKFWG